MKRLIGIVLALLLIAPVSAQSPQIRHLMLRQMPLAGGGGGGSPTITPGASVAPQFPNFSGTTLTFSGLNGGVNFPTGADVYVFFGDDQGSAPASAPLIGGQTATLVAGASDSTLNCFMYHAIMTGSNPDTFAVGNGSQWTRAGVASAYFTGIQTSPTASSNEAFGNQGDPQFPSTAIAIPTSGFGFSAVWVLNNSLAVAGNTATWQTTTPSFITGAGGDAFGLSTGHSIVASGHTTSVLAGATSWQPKVSGATSGYPFAACMSAVAVGP